MYSDERYVIRAVRAGARGYILKNSAGDELIQAVHAVQKGTAFFSPAVARVFRDGYGRLKDATEAVDPYELLTRQGTLMFTSCSPKGTATRISPIDWT